MVMLKILNINPVTFRSMVQPEKKQDNNRIQNTTKLQNATPDFNVHTPQKYAKLGVTNIAGGLQLHSYKLANGHRVSIVPMEESPTVVKNYVKVGSLNETDDIKGISHFLEHMAFNGTNGSNGYIKLNQGDSFKKIDELGGWTNASTNYAVTDYVNSTPLLDSDDLKKQLSIIAAMTEDLQLSDTMIEKEKGPVCSEINMILDSPETITMDQTVRTLFNITSSADELVGGSVKHIKNLNREKVLEYYNKYYVPENMNLVITGNVNPDKTMELVSKLFKSNKKAQGRTFEEKITPINSTKRKDFISDKAISTEIMLGFSGPKNNDTKSKIIFEIIQKSLNSGTNDIKKALKEFNTEPFLGMEDISTNPNNPTLIYYSLNCDDSKSEEVLKIIFNKLSKLKSPSNLNLIKESLKQDNDNSMSYSSNVNSAIGYSLLNKNEDYLTNYNKILDSITTEDIQDFINEYLNINKTALTLVHPKENNLNVSFKGQRKPLNSKSISTKTLKNNYETAFYNTKNNNISIDLNLHFDVNKNVNPAAKAILSEIYQMGPLGMDEDSYNKYKEDNLLNVCVEMYKGTLNINSNANKRNYDKLSEITSKLLTTPAITQENLAKAKQRIRDSINRTPESSVMLYNEYESINNPYYTTRKRILEDLDKITVADIKALHEYILKSSRGLIAMNIPETSPEMAEVATKDFEKLPTVRTNDINIQKIYKENSKPQVITKARPLSQADIMETFKFPIANTAKERATIRILNTILSSSSIGLFNTLREKEQLAYSVYSSTSKCGDCGELSLNILTTTDNDKNGEVTYDNLQKSINGFNNVINSIKNAEYTDNDIESAKRLLKADLLNKEGLNSKTYSLSNGLNTPEGVEFDNIMFNEIDNISRNDLKELANKIFESKPVYSIVASENTLNANKKFLEEINKEPLENL